MSAAKKRKYDTPIFRGTSEKDHQNQLRLAKAEIEQYREKLNSRILDNPRLARKAAALISLWIEGKTKRSKNSR